MNHHFQMLTERFALIMLLSALFHQIYKCVTLNDRSFSSPINQLINRYVKTAMWISRRIVYNPTAKRFTSHKQQNIE